MTRSRAGDFEAYPRYYSGRGAGGTPEAPGFHTASSADVTIPYAAMKISQHLPSAWDKETKARLRDEGIPDAGVIVGIDMVGFEPFPDYDAEHAVESVDDLIREFGKEANEEDNLYDQFYDYVEQWGDSGWGEPEDEPDDIVQLLFALTWPSPDSLAYSIRNWLEGLDKELAHRILLEAVRHGPDASMLMNSIGQFRYLADVPTSRIMEVSVLKPWFDRIFPTWDSEDYPTKKVEAIEAAGFQTASIENFYDRSIPDDMVASWTRPPSQHVQLWLPGMEVQPRLEYHGTSLVNLILAAPELQSIVELVPPPFNPRAFWKEIEEAERIRRGE